MVRGLLLEVNYVSYRITAFAEKCGVNKETIRYYEQKFITRTFPNESGYRIYSDDDVKRVWFIKRMQELGFL